MAGPSPSIRKHSYSSPFNQGAPPPQQADPFGQGPEWGRPDPYIARRQQQQQMERERMRAAQQQQRSMSDLSFGDDPFGVTSGRGSNPMGGRQPRCPDAALRQQPMSSAPNRFLCVTTDDIPGFDVVQIKGPVQGSVTRDERAEVSLAEDRNRAAAQMIEEAKMLGANAIMGMKYDTHAPQGFPSAEVAVYGTACQVRPMGARSHRPRRDRYPRREPSFTNDSAEDMGPSDEEEFDRPPSSRPMGRRMFPPQEDDVFGISLGDAGMRNDGASMDSRGERRRRDKHRAKVGSSRLTAKQT